MVKHKFWFSRKDFGNYGLERLKNEYSDIDIDSAINPLLDLVDSGLYSELYVIYRNWNEPVPLDSSETAEIALESQLLVLSYENLTSPHNPFSSHPIDHNVFYSFYPFLEWVYSMYLKRQLTAEDVKSLFKSDIGERITFQLMEFDQNREIPSPTSEFFQKLSKLKWKDKKTHKLNEKLEEMIRFFVFEKFGFKEGSFLAHQHEVNLFLIGCNTIKNNREIITAEDVLIAYKTIFKIIKTDLRAFINNKSNNIEPGYLVCNKCNSYYELQNGESADDFEDNCDCGGHLVYKESI